MSLYECLYPGCIGRAGSFLCETHQLPIDVQLAQKELAAMREELKLALEENSENLEQIEELEKERDRETSRADHLEEDLEDLQEKLREVQAALEEAQK